MSDQHEPYDLSPEDVGKLIGVHADTVKRWAKAQKIPGIKLPGGWWRFRTSEITAHLDASRNDPAGKAS